jgi:hypothetical protein
VASLRTWARAIAILLAACGGRPASISGAPEGGALSDAGHALDGSSGLDASAAREGAPGACQPLEGCSSSTTCPAPDGCNTCSCQPGGVWECTGFPCDAGGHDCPTAVQQSQSCNQSGLMCTYPLAAGSACTTWDCECHQGTWNCAEEDCDAGQSTHYSCPTTQPPMGSTCPSNGAACSYGPCESFGGNGINCLCFEGEWQCAALPGCDAGK